VAPDTAFIFAGGSSSRNGVTSTNGMAHQVSLDGISTGMARGTNINHIQNNNFSYRRDESSVSGSTGLYNNFHIDLPQTPQPISDSAPVICCLAHVKFFFASFFRVMCFSFSIVIIVLYLGTKAKCLNKCSNVPLYEDLIPVMSFPGNLCP
jgi:hypothetical protein